MEWIDVNDRLPEGRYKSIFAKYKNTEKWDTSMFTTYTEPLLVTIEYPNSQKVVTTASMLDDHWNVQTLCDYKVIAWMPYPKPYGEE